MKKTKCLLSVQTDLLERYLVHMIIQVSSYDKASYATAQKKIVNLVTSATNSTVIDYASAFTEVKDTCKDVLAATKQVHDLAEI